MATVSSRDKNKTKTTTSSTKVISIASKSDFDKIVDEAGNKHVLVEFFATWCGPCAIIGPHIEKMADEYEDCLLVLKIDVDDNVELAEEYDISSMPSFVIIKNKVKLEQFVGSNAERVQSALQKFCSKPADSKPVTTTPTTSARTPEKASTNIMNLIKTVAAKSDKK